MNRFHCIFDSWDFRGITMNRFSRCSEITGPPGRAHTLPPRQESTRYAIARVDSALSNALSVDPPIHIMHEKYAPRASVFGFLLKTYSYGAARSAARKNPKLGRSLQAPRPIPMSKRGSPENPLCFKRNAFPPIFKNDDSYQVTIHFLPQRPFCDS